MPTIKYIAKKANVSTATVDRVIHDRGKVAPKTKKRIMMILNELNFKPNIFAQTLKRHKKYNFGVLMPELSQDSGFWEMAFRGIQMAETELDGFSIDVVYYHYNKYSMHSFEKRCKDILDTHPDGLLIAPVPSKTGLKCLIDNPSDLPVVFFDSNLPDTKFLSYIGQCAFQSGVVAAKLMMVLTRNAGSIVIFRILPEDNHINDRVEGFKSYIQTLDKSNIFTYDIDGNSDDNFFQQTLNEVLAGHPDLAGIFITNVCSHKIAKQIKGKKLKKHIHLVGYDLIDENIRYLKDGTIDFLISQQPELQGYEGVYILYRHVVLNEQVQQTITKQIDVVMKENVDYCQSFLERKPKS